MSLLGCSSESRRTGVLIFCSAAVAMGCGGPASGHSETKNTGEYLATGFKTTDTRFTTPWSSPGVVNVCFAPPAGQALNATLQADATAAIQQSWGFATGLTFSINGLCPASIPSNWISIFLDSAAGNGVTAMGGVGARLNVAPWANEARVGGRTDIQIYVGTRAGEYRMQVAHEVGHALGFYHEMERSDHTSDSDPNCALGSNTQGHVTPFDRTSIMLWSYCTGTGRAEDELLSEFDRLGGEMMYPKTQTAHRVRCSGACMETGSGAVVADNGAVTVDWVRRGANVDPAWKVGTQTFQNSDGRLPATSLPAGSTPVTMTFPDAYGRTNSGSGTVLKSTAYHAAIVTTTGAL